MESSRSNELTLFKAAEQGDLAEVEELLKQGVSFATRFNDNYLEDLEMGRDALYIAIKNSHIEIVKLLLNKGANPNLTYRINWTPLSLAVVTSAENEITNHKRINDSIEIIKLLIDFAADVNPTIVLGKSPIDYTTDPTIISMLVQKGAKQRIIQAQDKLIKNYQSLVDILQKNKILTSLISPDEEGICDGLSKSFIFYEKQRRSDEFQFFLTFINKLSQDDMQKLAEEYKINSKLHGKCSDKPLITQASKSSRTEAALCHRKNH